MDNYQPSNVAKPKELSESILEDLEISQLPISQVLMKTKRLARMLHDSDAQRWLDFEIGGYPPVFDPKELGACKKYYIANRLVINDEKTRRPHPIGIPHLESYIRSTTVESIAKLGVTEAQKMQIMNRHHELVNDFERLKAMIHNYVTDVNISLTVGELSESIFEETREVADRFIRENCPRCGEELLAIHEKMRNNDTESILLVFGAVQKILIEVADAVFRAQAGTSRDRKGVERNVGPDQYVNRIFLFVDQNTRDDTLMSMIESEMKYISAKSGQTGERGKDPHGTISHNDARLAVLHMYMLVGEVAKVNRIDTVYLNRVSKIVP